MVWDFGALGPAREVFERVDHRHLDDLLPGLPASSEDTAQLLADFLGDQLARADLPFAHLVGDVAVVDAWPDAGSWAWESVVRPLRFHAAHRLDGLPDGHELHQRSLNEVLGRTQPRSSWLSPWGRSSPAISRSRG
jgi:hypothetical protein